MPEWPYPVVTQRSSSCLAHSNSTQSRWAFVTEPLRESLGEHVSPTGSQRFHLHKNNSIGEVVPFAERKFACCSSLVFQTFRLHLSKSDRMFPTQAATLDNFRSLLLASFLP